jgi:hypothetical protein
MAYGANVGAGFVTPVQQQRGRMHALPILPGGTNPMATNPFAALMPGVGGPQGGNRLPIGRPDMPGQPPLTAGPGFDPRRLALLARMRMARHGVPGTPSGPGPRFRRPPLPGQGVPTEPGGTRGPVRGLPIQRPYGNQY